VEHTITLRKSAAIPSETIVIHSLNHGCVPTQDEAHIIVSPAASLTTTTSLANSTFTTATFQAINLPLSVFSPFLRLLKVLLELLDVTVLLCVAFALFVLLTPVGDAIVQAHRCREGADQRRSQSGHDESFLIDM
jgi:hypothetical protein